MVLVAMCGIRQVHGAPSDIFATVAPIPATTTPKEAALQDGDASVSTQTGAFQYRYPIAVPPGRNGIQPHLALTYSSQAPIYGGLAAGWSLSIPSIDEDTRTGARSSTYMSALAGGRPLIAVQEPHPDDVRAVYRAQNDASFMRYQEISWGGAYAWRVYAPDGSVFYFGDSDHTSSCSTLHDSSSRSLVAPLTRTIDAFGNAVEYFYEAGVGGECRISSITWGQNAGAGLASFAGISFQYATSPPACPNTPAPVGSQISYRTGNQIATGASELDQITINAYAPGSEATPDHTRIISLMYSAADAGCNNQRAPLRSLSSIQESAWGTDSPRVDLPSVDFTYGPATIFPSSSQASVSSSAPWFDPHLASNLGWGYRYHSSQWPSVEAMMLDVDGDGLVDRVYNDSTPSMCGMSWQRNLGNGTFVLEPHISLPTLKWATPSGLPPYQGGSKAGAAPSLNFNEACALNYQSTAYRNSSSFACGDSTDGTNATTCLNGTDSNSTLTNAVSSGAPPTYLAYRWFDIDGDGLPDLVVSMVGGGVDVYNPQHGNGAHGLEVTPLEPPTFGTFPSCPSVAYGVPDSTPAYTMCNRMHPWFIYKNHGNGVFGRPNPNAPFPLPDVIKYQPASLEPSTGDSTIVSRPSGSAEGSIDINGDGRPDEVWISPSDGEWHVFPNDGTGQYTQEVPFVANSDSFLSVSNPATAPYSLIGVQGLLDINGDGLVDHWAGSGTGSSSSADFAWNNGQGYAGFSVFHTSTMRPGPDVGSEFIEDQIGAKSIFFTTRGSRADASQLLDLDGDGRVDIVQDPQIPQQGNPPGLAAIYFNQGGQFGSQTAAGDIRAFRHMIVASDNGPSDAGANTFYWELRSDMLDIDGDGIPEGIVFSGIPLTDSGYTGAMSVTHVPTPSQPSRLLISVNNNRGATTSIAYAPMSNANVVTQHPELGKASPNPQWVVQSITTVDAASTVPTTSTTTYKYINPRYSADDQGQYALRGFEETDATLPSGAMAVDRFDYSADWSGRLRDRE